MCKETRKMKCCGDCLNRLKEKASEQNLKVEVKPLKASERERKLFCENSLHCLGHALWSATVVTEENVKVSKLVKR